MRSPFDPYYLLAYLNPYTGEVVRQRISGAMLHSAPEALRGQGVKHLAIHKPEDWQWHEASIRRFAS